jgi:hypothetical protein
MTSHNFNSTFVVLIVTFVVWTHVNTGHGYYTPTECCLTPSCYTGRSPSRFAARNATLAVNGCMMRRLFSTENDSFILGFCHRLVVVVTVGTRIQPWASSGICRLAERSFDCSQGPLIQDIIISHCLESARHRSLRIVDYQRRPGCDHPRCRSIRISSSARSAFVRHCS